MTALDDGIQTATKCCFSCKQEKSLDQFYSNRSNKDGKANRCSECDKANQKKSYALAKAGAKSTNRADRFLHGHLHPSELTMDELTGGFIYMDDGSKHYSNDFEKRARGKFQAELARRLNRFIKEKSARSIEIIFEIADSDLVEPADRLKAATWIAERVIGKTPEVLQMSVTETPHEAIFENLRGGARNEYRAQIGQAIDAEVISDEEMQSESDRDSGVEDGKRDSDDGLLHEDGIETDDEGNLRSTDDARGHVFDEPAADETKSGSVESNSEASSEDVADKIVAKRNEAQALKKRIADAKKKRYAARAVGAKSLATAPWLIDWRIHERGLLACLVPPVNLTPAKLEIIKANDEATNDVLFIATQRANRLAAQAQRAKAKLEGLNNDV